MPHVGPPQFGCPSEIVIGSKCEQSKPFRVVERGILENHGCEHIAGQRLPVDIPRRFISPSERRNAHGAAVPIHVEIVGIAPGLLEILCDVNGRNIDLPAYGDVVVDLVAAAAICRNRSPLVRLATTLHTGTDRFFATEDDFAR